VRALLVCAWEHGQAPVQQSWGDRKHAAIQAVQPPPGPVRDLKSRTGPQVKISSSLRIFVALHAERQRSRRGLRLPPCCRS
jgi:hypothetical protein